MFHRLPLYSSLLAASFGIFTTPAAGVVLCHSVVTFFALLLICTLTLGNPRPAAIAAGVALALFPIRGYAHYVLAEWFCALALVVLWLLALRHTRRPSAGGLFFITLTCALLCAMRAALIPIMVFPIPFLWGLRAKRHAIAALLLGCIPIIITAAANLYRFGEPKLSFLLGHQVAVKGALAGGTKAPSENTHQFLKIFEEARADLYSKLGIHEDDKNLYGEYLNPDHTLYTAILDTMFKAQRAAGLDFLQAESLALQYGLKAIRMHPKTYLELVLRGLRESRLLLILILGLCLLGATQMHYLPATMRPLVLASSAFYFLYSLELSILQYVIPRYVEIVFFPLCGLFVILLSQITSPPSPQRQEPSPS
ncbi:MAG: hypothetical protein EBZ48_06745 [Proteobacteria bacterium]|nr:hypothetical protein [Pseudomonadota bacterium]